MVDVTFSAERFVNVAEGNVQVAFDSYQILLDMGMTKKDALELVLEETREAAACYARLGSCGNGGCKHG